MYRLVDFGDKCSIAEYYSVKFKGKQIFLLGMCNCLHVIIAKIKLQNVIVLIQTLPILLHLHILTCPAGVPHRKPCIPKDMIEVNTTSLEQNYLFSSRAPKCLHRCKETSYVITSTSGKIDESVVETYFNAIHDSRWKQWDKNKYVCLLQFITICVHKQVLHHDNKIRF